MNKSRRKFLKRSGATLLGASVVGALGPRTVLGDDGDGGSPPTLVVLYMRGGADPLSVIIPHADPLYYQVRQTLSIPKPGQENGCLPLNPSFGLHPAMAGLHALYQKGLLAPIVNVGCHHETRSHFDAQDFMEYAAPGVRTITEGWLNRFLSATNEGQRKEVELRALAMQPLLPRSLRGEMPVLAVPQDRALASMDAFEDVYMGGAGDMAARPETPDEDQTPSIIEAGRNTIRKLRHYETIVSGRNATAARYPGTPLGQQFSQVARVIKADCGLEVAAIDYNGWDHHANGGRVDDGKMMTMAGNVSDSISAFVEDLGPERMKKVLVLTMSEFGRTVRENGNNGTDHGHGGFMLAVGGMVKGGQLYGQWTGLETKSLWKNRDMPVHTDFRIVFAETLRRLFDFRGLDGFFPDWRPASRALDFLKQV